MTLKVPLDSNLVVPADNETVSDNFSLHMKVQKLRSDAVLPTIATEGSAGYDFYTPQQVVCRPLETTSIPLGVAVAVPRGFALLFIEKSGIAKRTGLQLKGGLIDSDYRGELIVMLYNTDKENPVIFSRGEKVVQGILLPVLTTQVIEVDRVGDTTRGSGGFGSTGA